MSEIPAYILEQNQEFLLTLNSQFRMLGPSAVRFRGRVWVRLPGQTPDLSRADYPAHTYAYRSVGIQGDLEIKITLNIGQDLYEIGIARKGETILALEGIYFDQFKEIQRWLERAEQESPGWIHE